ncbi:uncharacterized protein EKO05_0010512 [Ascochyta rabiei]|uniref:uncharacterized protein n=1 Tax=Didymella rabiei TaxID=5454 RepID=UPI00220E64A0|nr:uncharacterized protein EKO05_0010512 [Ascochyta rabiei]UPX20274.1 hypothetical protein EKO05_0010512 [Ascochyta rabiei]
MTSSVFLPSQNIWTRLRYLKRSKIYKAIRPYTLACKVDEGFPTNNLLFEEGPLEHLTDIRGLDPGQVTLEKNGFTTIQHKFEQSTANEEAIKEPGGYLDAIQQLARDVLTAEGVQVEQVKVINWVFRTAKKDEMFANADMTGQDFRAFAPDTYVHNDCNYYGGDKRIRALLGAETDTILASKRVRLINFWKPINNPVEDCQLAICDASTVQHDKCIHGDFIVNPDYISQTNYAAPCEEQKWYWLSNQQIDEVIIFKQHDTEERSSTRYCPHTAFWRNDPHKCSVQRESIEVRILVVCSN